MGPTEALLPKYKQCVLYCKSPSFMSTFALLNEVKYLFLIQYMYTSHIKHVLGTTL